MEFEDLSRKRKHHNLQGQYQSTQPEKLSKTDDSKSIFGVEFLPLETPLPSKWQRRVDVKSGQIHFCSTRTQRKIVEDPSRRSEPASHTRLDLELNLLPCDSAAKQREDDQSSTHNGNKSGSSKDLLVDLNQENEMLDFKLNRSPSWLEFDAGDEDQREQQEMVATVCMKCHMLVMLCKASPVCPNCKFMHTPEQSSPKLFKPSRLSLFC